MASETTELGVEREDFLLELLELLDAVEAVEGVDALLVDFGVDLVPRFLAGPESEGGLQPQGRGVDSPGGNGSLAELGSGAGKEVDSRSSTLLAEDGGGIVV